MSEPETDRLIYIRAELHPVSVPSWGVKYEAKLLYWDTDWLSIIEPQNIDWAQAPSFTATYTGSFGYEMCKRRLARHIAHAAYGLRRRGSQGWRKRG